MVLKINTNKAKIKVEEFLSEIEKLMKEPYSRNNEDKKTDLNARITNFVRATFQDPEEKINSYKDFVFFIGEKTQMEKRHDYENSLKKKKRHLIAWKEEIELNEETDSESENLDEINKKIKKADLESERRQKVTESKFYGAVMELLDFQRNLIKEKEQTTKAIIEIKKDILDIKDMLKK